MVYLQIALEVLGENGCGWGITWEKVEGPAGAMVGLGIELSVDWEVFGEERSFVPSPGDAAPPGMPAGSSKVKVAVPVVPSLDRVRLTLGTTDSVASSSRQATLAVGGAGASSTAHKPRGAL